MAGRTVLLLALLTLMPGLASAGTEMTQAELDENFQEMDADEDGKVSLAELEDGLHNVLCEGTNMAVEEGHEQARQLFPTADADRDGSLSKRELLTILNKLK